MSGRRDIVWMDARRRLRDTLQKGLGILPKSWVVWGEMLHGHEIVTFHDFPSWHEKAPWYIEQIEQFIADSEAYIEKELAPFQNHLIRRKVA